jgi:hypothetical protein
MGLSPEPLAVIGPILAGLEGPRWDYQQAIDVHNAATQDGGIGARRVELDLLEAEENERHATSAAVKRIEGMDPAMLSPAHRVIASLVIGQTQHARPDVANPLGRITEGFDAYAPVAADFVGPPQFILVPRTDGVTLYKSQGSQDLVADKGQIKAVYTGGLRADVTPILSASFPDVKVSYGVEESFPILSRLHCRNGDWFADLRAWTPNDPAYRLPFMRLGNHLQPVHTEPIGLVDPENEHGLTTDEQLFCARWVARQYREEDWLRFARPSGTFRQAFAEAFGEIFYDLLSGQRARDDMQTIQSPLYARGGTVEVIQASLRKRSLASYERAELKGLLAAADVACEEVAEATKEHASLAAKVNTPQSVMDAIRFRRDFRQFFKDLFEIEVHI